MIKKIKGVSDQALPLHSSFMPYSNSFKSTHFLIATVHTPRKGNGKPYIVVREILEPFTVKFLCV